MRVRVPLLAPNISETTPVPFEIGKFLRCLLGGVVRFIQLAALLTFLIAFLDKIFVQLSKTLSNLDLRLSPYCALISSELRSIQGMGSRPLSGIALADFRRL